MISYLLQHKNHIPAMNMLCRCLHVGIETSACVSCHSTVNRGSSCGTGTFQGTSVQSYPFHSHKVVWPGCRKAADANVMTDQRLTFSSQGNDINSFACFPSFPRFCGFCCDSLHSGSSHHSCSSLLATEEEKVRCLAVTSQKNSIFFLRHEEVLVCPKLCTFFILVRFDLL